MASYAKFDVWQNTQGVNYHAVVQAVSNNVTTPISINTATPTTVISVSITTKLPGSKLLILYSDDCNADTAGAWKYIAPYVDGVEYGKHITSVADAGFQDMVAISRLVGPVSQGAHTVDIKAYQGSAQSTFHEAGAANLTVLEIAQ
jgi:hypothetical protein